MAVGTSSSARNLCRRWSLHRLRVALRCVALRCVALRWQGQCCSPYTTRVAIHYHDRLTASAASRCRVARGFLSVRALRLLRCSRVLCSTCSTRRRRGAGSRCVLTRSGSLCAEVRSGFMDLEFCRILDSGGTSLRIAAGAALAAAAAALLVAWPVGWRLQLKEASHWTLIIIATSN